jgi:hypothetical protein
MKTLANERCQAEIARRLKSLRPESRRRWGRMSAPQMVCHLCDACRMATGRLPVNGVAGVFPRTLVKWAALYVPLRWPPGFPTLAEINQERGGTKPADFAGDVAELESLLDFIATREAGFEWPAHPLFGRMSRRDWLRWAYLHADHHLRQFGA